MVREKTILSEVKQYYGRVKNYVNGEWVDSQSTEVLNVTNPATGEAIAEVPLSTRDEVRQAVESAHHAFREWRETPPPNRTQYLFALKNLMEEHKEDLARIVTQENGKCIGEARGEVRRAIENVEVATGVSSLMMGYNLEDIARKIDEDC
ncbi:MAG: aldehyde dehydrogenase family protein, partial [Dehalococcoidia bacterium]